KGDSVRTSIAAAERGKSSGRKSWYVREATGTRNRTIDRSIRLARLQSRNQIQLPIPKQDSRTFGSRCWQSPRDAERKAVSTIKRGATSLATARIRRVLRKWCGRFKRLAKVRATKLL